MPKNEGEQRVQGHTPADWKYEIDEDGSIIIRTDSDTAICEMVDETEEDWTIEEKLANARLIAAAPELLQTLKDINDELLGDLPVTKLIKEWCEAAISKADGRE